MLNANFNSALCTAILSSLVFLVACKSPEEKRSEQILHARSFSEAGATSDALEILEKLAEQYPNDEEILGSIGQVYSMEGDFKTAAFFFEQAHLQAPNDTERLYQAYLGAQAAMLPAGHLLEKLSIQATDRMTSELWIHLGKIRQTENKVKPALEAYLNGVDPETTTPNPEIAASIGQLFAKTGNLNQAKIWLQIAVSNGGPNSLTALFELLEINLRQQDWLSAESVITELDAKFPGAIDASAWKETRQEIVVWREAQNAMKTELSKIRVENANLTQNNNISEDYDAVIEGKDQVIADLEIAEAMAEALAIETEDTDTISNEVSIIPPKSASREVILEVNEESNTSDLEIISMEYDPEGVVTGDNLEATETQLLRTIQELLSDASAAELEQDYNSAITNYWTAMGVNNNRADIWNLLSRAYFADGQIANADIAALEAVRLEPLTVAYTLDYLRVAQKSKLPNAFLSQLEIAYSRFPESAEIILSLARAHERISGQNATARNLYLRFIEIAPKHPLIPEAEAAVSRL
ncbi:MAG: tetratricopeptide repeat protein [Verrucomicrobiota bacterium]|nr:tetratricopeptide repeat protein [Verrucomicrobiota bacterium]